MYSVTKAKRYIPSEDDIRKIFDTAEPNNRLYLLVIAHTLGRITAINPLVDADTRQIKMQATVANLGNKLRPGMFANVAVGLPVRQKVLAIPATAVLYAPYGDSVFIIEDAADKKGKELHQQFVRLGVKRGDFVAVTSGIREGETVVSTGVFKLRNGQPAVIDNTLAPDFRKAPTPENS